MCFASATPVVGGTCLGSRCNCGQGRRDRNGVRMRYDVSLAAGMRVRPANTMMTLLPAGATLGLAALGIAAAVAMIALRKRITESVALWWKSLDRKSQREESSDESVAKETSSGDVSASEIRVEDKAEQTKEGISQVAALDKVRDRAVAELEANILAMEKDSKISNSEYRKLSPSQKRELMFLAFKEGRKKRQEGVYNMDNLYALSGTKARPPDAWLRNDVPRPSTAESIRLVNTPGYNSYGRRVRSSNNDAGGTTAGTWGGFRSDSGRSTEGGANRQQQQQQQRGNNESTNNRQSLISRWRQNYLRAAEAINGRAAALGFILCLAREMFEPGHPSLFDQVEDVLVPIAQHTPPFVVAMCDRLVDLVL